MASDDAAFAGTVIDACNAVGLRFVVVGIVERSDEWLDAARSLTA